MPFVVLGANDGASQRYARAFDSVPSADADCTCVAVIVPQSSAVSRRTSSQLSRSVSCSDG
eukprot:5877270-Pleurochrysis_carterae.AAC.1